jgi:hypothetical protein
MKTCASCHKQILPNEQDVTEWCTVGSLNFHVACYKEPTTELEYLIEIRLLLQSIWCEMSRFLRSRE